jgi:hypothetical protein
MSVALRVVSVAGMPEIDQYNGRFIASYEDTACGRGTMTFSNYFAGALRFTTAREALSYWRQISRTVPVRPDGRPNRPLTAFTVEIVREGDDG